MKYDNYIRLEVLTPVHIGSGDTSDPLDYVIASKDKQDYFCQIDLDGWLEDYPEQEELANVLDSGNLAAIRKYIADNLDVDIYGHNRSRIISPEIGKKYKQHIANTNSPNQLLIDPALKNPLTGGLLIPGSSIKGAMRTAVIDWCDQNWHLDLKNCRNYTSTLEKALGSIRDSAFKQLKIGDFEAVNSASAVITAKEKSIKAEKTDGTPKHSCEICLSTATEGNCQHLFGRFSIGEQSKRENCFLSCNMNGKVQKWSLIELFKLVSDFYRQRYQKEKQKFFAQSHFAKSGEVIKFLDTQFAALSENQMILRVGHYSHIECMTVTNNKPGGKKGYGKTRTLADGVYPFGWVKLTMCSKEEHHNYWQQKCQHEQEMAEERQQLRKNKIEQRQQQLQQQLEQQRQHQQAEQARLAQVEDERQNPWKKVVRNIEQIDNWGELKRQILENEELLHFRNESEFAQVVHTQAVAIQKNASKWGEERDNQLEQWFEPSDLSWQTSADKTAVEPLSPEVEQINNFKDWSDFINGNIQIDVLNIDALNALKVKLKKWKCDNKKAKKPKLNAWKEVCQRLKTAVK